MNIAIVKYNAGNVQSVIFALERMGLQPLLTDDQEQIRSADKVIFPGQGEASSAMRYLRQRSLDKMIRNLRQPVLGICIGQQLLCQHSEEGDVACIGVFPQKVIKFIPKLKVPHMGWNQLEGLKGPLFDGISEKAYMYFVHSYYCEVGQDTAATTQYVNPFSAALQKDNFYAVQGHPEKSGSTGQKILENFLKL